MNELSRRGGGETDDPQAGSIASNFRGHFILKNAVLTFENLSFSVPSVSVQTECELAGQALGNNDRFQILFVKSRGPFFKKKNVGAVISHQNRRDQKLSVLWPESVTT